MDGELLAAICLVGGYAVFFGLLGLILRPHTDKDGDGKISYQEIPVLSHYQGRIVTDGTAGLYDFILTEMAYALFQSWATGFLYGLMGTVLANYIVAPYVASSYSWVFAVIFAHVGDMYMCGFASNTIHIITGHWVHFIYYILGFMATFYYFERPAWYILFISNILCLGIFTAFKFYAWPEYPDSLLIIDMYELQEDGTFTKIVDAEENRGRPVEEQQGLEAGKYLPLPAFEVIHGIFAGGMTWGFALGRIAVNVIRLVSWDTTHLECWLVVTSLGLVLGLAHSLIPLPAIRQWNKQSANVYGAVISVLGHVFGATIASTMRDSFDDDSTGELVATILMVVSHSTMITLGLLGFVATSKHVGSCLRSCGRWSLVSHLLPGAPRPVHDHKDQTESVELR